jgi:RNase P subunit RPR2
MKANFTSDLERTLTKRMLKYTAGHVMFCPTCDNILDWSRTVDTSFIAKDSGDAFKTIITCTECFDAKVKPVLEGSAIKVGENVEIKIIDGRDF